MSTDRTEAHAAVAVPSFDRLPSIGEPLTKIRRSFGDAARKPEEATTTKSI